MEGVQILEKLDLSFITNQLQARENMTVDQASRATERYRQFLLTAARNPDATLVPTKEVDAAWHCHMLNPIRYFEMCIGIFGRVLDHDPTVYRTDAYNKAWEETRKLVPYGGEMPESPYVSDAMVAGAGCYLPPLAVNAGAGCYLPPLKRAA